MHSFSFLLTIFCEIELFDTSNFAFNYFVVIPVQKKPATLAI